MTNRVIDHIVSKVIQHHHDSGEISTKESRDNVSAATNSLYDSRIADDGGDLKIGVALINIIAICERNGTSIETCLNAAYDEIRG